MAKTTDQLAGKAGTRATGGLLPTGLLADEKSLDRRGLWRLGSWAGIAIIAVTTAMIASQYATALRQDEATATELARQSRQIQTVAKDSQTESRRLSSAIDTLNGDRDRLFARVTVLEQGWEALNGAKPRQSSTASATVSAEPSAPGLSAATAVTGAAAKPTMAAMARQTDAPAAIATPAAPEPQVSPMAIAKSAIGAVVRADAVPAVKAAAPEAATPPPSAASAANAPVAEPPAATGGAISGEKTLADKTFAEKTLIEKTLTEKTSAGKSAAERPAAETSAQPAATSAQGSPQTAMAAPLVATKSMLAPPDAAASKWVETAKPLPDATTAPDVVSSIGATEPDPDQSASAQTPSAQNPSAKVKHTEFAVDVGSASSVGGLRAMWLGLLKSYPALAKLVPIIVVKENSAGLGLQLRLVAGPLDDAAAAARICAGLAENKRSCEPTLFDGQRLALKAEDEFDAKNPDVKNAEARAGLPRSMMRRRYNYRRVVPAEDTAKKPETSFSSLFNRR